MPDFQTATAEKYEKISRLSLGPEEYLFVDFLNFFEMSFTFVPFLMSYDLFHFEKQWGKSSLKKTWNFARCYFTSQK